MPVPQVNPHSPQSTPKAPNVQLEGPLPMVTEVQVPPPCLLDVAPQERITRRPLKAAQVVLKVAPPPLTSSAAATKLPVKAGREATTNEAKRPLKAEQEASTDESEAIVPLKRPLTAEQEASTNEDEANAPLKGPPKVDQEATTNESKANAPPVLQMTLRPPLIKKRSPKTKWCTALNKEMRVVKFKVLRKGYLGKKLPPQDLKIPPNLAAKVPPPMMVTSEPASYPMFYDAESLLSLGAASTMHMHLTAPLQIRLTSYLRTVH